MNHESQTIQQQGRLFQIGQEERGSTGKHGEGEGWKMGKSRSWKHASNCKHCGISFPGRKGEKNEYCSQSCFNEFRVMKWLTCSICIASIGIGSQGASKILGIIDSGKIRKRWKERGIKSNRPKSGSIIHEGRMMATKARMEDQSKWGQYEKAWMDEIKSHKTFPDWGYEWQKEQSRKAGRAKYEAMSYSERRALVRRQIANRCPIKAKSRLREWKSRERIKNPAYRIIESFRVRLWLVAKGRDTRTMDLIGCSLADFRSHIERHFKKGMTWENYGTHWHVDHTIPVSSFNHNNPSQLKQCWHWTNLKPMTAIRNLRKGARITDPQMELLLCTH